MERKYLGNKGQGAMEYLMTYAWAIMVIIVVGFVLWQLGAFDVACRTADNINYTEICKGIIPNTTEGIRLGPYGNTLNCASCERIEHMIVVYDNETMNVTIRTKLGIVCIQKQINNTKK